MAVVYHRGSPSDRPSGTRRPTPGRLTACPREATLGKAPLPALRRRRRLRLCSRRPATGAVPPPHRWTAAREVEGLDIDAYRFCVIGPGRLGSTLLAGLLEAGLAVAAVGVHADDDTDLGMIPKHVRVADAALEADAWWLTVPDDEIYTVAARLAASLPATRRGGRTQLAVHSSGLGSIHLLKPLFEQGIRVLCLHPLQTFTGDPRAELLRDVPCAVTAHEERDLQLGEELARRLGLRPFRLADDKKTLYHLCLLYTSDAADDLLCVDLGGRRIIKKKK